ncbi:MAG: MFS transporter [Actinomycetes bacterium]
MTGRLVDSMRTTFSATRVRNFRYFLIGMLVSNTGTWMQRIAQDWLVLELSHRSGLALGITAALQFGPQLVVAPIAGVVADRYPKRTVLFITQSSMMAITVLLGVLDLAGVVRLYDVYLLALALGVVASFDNPTRQSFVIEMVGREDVTNAVGLNSAAFNLARIIGPATAGFMIAGIGTAPVFLVNAASYLAMLAALYRMRVDELHPAPRIPTERGQIRAGLRYLRERPDLLMVVVLIFFVGTFGMNFQLLNALMATTVFGKGAGEYGLLGSFLAVGSLIGAFFAARRRRPRLRLVAGTALVFGVLEIGVGLMPTYLTYGLALIPMGIVMITVATAANATIQLGSAPQMRGRVMSIYMAVFNGGAVVGSPAIGWISQRLGPRWGILAGAIVVVVTASVVILILMHRERLRLSAHWHPRPHLSLRPADSGRQGRAVEVLAEEELVDTVEAR